MTIIPFCQKVKKGKDTYRPLKTIAKMDVTISAPVHFPVVTKNLPTQSCKAQEHIPNPYVNPNPSP